VAVVAVVAVAPVVAVVEASYSIFIGLRVKPRTIQLMASIFGAFSGVTSIV
jgi:hypothetical protein